MILKNTKIIPQILFVLISFVCNGQTSGAHPPPPLAPPIPVGVPIDNWWYVLLGLGLVYGIYKKYSTSKI